MFFEKKFSLHFLYISYGCFFVLKHVTLISLVFATFCFCAQARTHVEHLVGQFSSGMTSLLGKLVEGWTTLNGSDSDAVARQFTPFVAEWTHRPTGCRGRYDYNSSQEFPDTQDELDGDAGLDKDDDDDMENVQHATDDDEHGEVRVGGKKDKAAPNVPPPEEAIQQIVARDTGVSPSKRG